MSKYFQYEDDEGDKVLLATDGDLLGAVSHARSVGLKVIYIGFVCHGFWIFISFQTFCLVGYCFVCIMLSFFYS